MFPHPKRWLGAALAVALLSLPQWAKAQDKVVYYDANYSTNWLQDAAAQQVRDFFTGKGYLLVDAAQLRTFMLEHIASKKPSIAVMARDIPPDTVVDISSGAVVDTGNVIVDYMTAGGRVVQLADWPFYNIAKTAVETSIPDPAVRQRSWELRGPIRPPDAKTTPDSR